MAHEDVVRIARQVHSTHWRLTGDEGTGDRLAAQITREWQSQVLNSFPDRCKPEHPVGNLRERIDLVDVIDGVAYEMKVSPNNDHFEFYRDVFKVIVARDNGSPYLKAFVFLCPASAAKRFSAGLRQAVLSDGARLGLSLHVEGP